MLHAGNCLATLEKYPPWLSGLSSTVVILLECKPVLMCGLAFEQLLFCIPLDLVYPTSVPRKTECWVNQVLDRVGVAQIRHILYN